MIIQMIIQMIILIIGSNEPMYDASPLVNAQLGYDLGNVQVWINANNLLNETYISRVTDVSSGQLTVGDPKHVSVNIEAMF